MSPNTSITTSSKTSGVTWSSRGKTKGSPIRVWRLVASGSRAFISRPISANSMVRKAKSPANPSSFSRICPMWISSTNSGRRFSRAKASPSMAKKRSSAMGSIAATSPRATPKPRSTGSSRTSSSRSSKASRLRSSLAGWRKARFCRSSRRKAVPRKNWRIFIRNGCKKKRKPTPFIHFSFRAASMSSPRKKKRGSSGMKAISFTAIRVRWHLPRIRLPRRAMPMASSWPRRSSAIPRSTNWPRSTAASSMCLIT